MAKEEISSLQPSRCVLKKETSSPHPLLQDAARPSVTVVVHTIGGESILGPREYPSTVTLSQLQGDIMATPAARSSGAFHAKLIYGDRVLRGDTSIISGLETLSLSCVLLREVRISAEWRSPYRDWIQSWRLKVTPLVDNSRAAVEEWLLPKNSAGESVEPATLQEMSGEAILAECRMAESDLEKEDWELFKALMQQAGSGQCVHWPPFSYISGWKAVIAGHGVEWILEKGF